MGKKIAISLYVNYQPDIFNQWIYKMKLFEPNYMKFGHMKTRQFIQYNENKFLGEIEKEKVNSLYNAHIRDGINSIAGFMNSNSENIGILMANLDYTLYYNNEKFILELINSIMVKYGVVGTITDLSDNVLQNDMDLESYKAGNKSLEGIPLKDHPLFKGKKAVDVEKMPGYEVLIGNIWFGAAWKMWFSDSYYDYISKDSIKNFSECYSNEQIADTCRCITLYENVSDYDAPQSRERQWKFKEAIDFQNTVNRLKQSGILYDNDPHIEIEDGSFSHGGMKLFKLYQDIEGNSIVRSKAVKVRVLEYNRAGKIVWEEEEKL